MLVSQSAPNTPFSFLLASRPKTWIASISPVLIGTALAAQTHGILPAMFFMTLLFSFLVQVGTNFANDYFDFVKGADSPLRQGPKRAVQEGWISPSAMLGATWAVFGIAFMIAIPLMAVAGLWSLPLTVLCIALGVLYTGGPKPLGYFGLGDILVLFFFGPVPVCGTYFLQTRELSWEVFLASLAPGLLSCSLLVANNLRDAVSDKAAKKTTLVVRFGQKFGCWEYACSLLFASLIPVLLVRYFDASLNVIAASVIAFLAIPLIKKAFQSKEPLEFLSLLQGSSLLLFVYTALFCFGLL